MGRSAIVVLGMHRSGTSSVAGALSMLGAAPPRTLMSPAQDNPRGFWESVVLADFNDRLLAAGGSRWDDPRPFDLAAVSGVDGFAQEAAHLLRAEFDDRSLIVMKDPRVCRLFPFWGEVLEATGHDVAVVSPLRDPAEVAASLTRRNGFPPRQGLGLWLRHVLDAEAASRGRPRVFLPWSDFLADWRGAADTLRTRLALPLDAPPRDQPHAVDDFLSRDLRHQAACAPGDDPLAIRAWQALTHLARHGEEPAIHGELDAVRAEFDRRIVADV